MIAKPCKLYLTRSEIFTAAWRRLRVEHGAKATPRQTPAAWAAILRATWAAAKGDAFELLAIRTYADAAACTSARAYCPTPAMRHSYSRASLKLVSDFAA